MTTIAIHQPNYLPWLGYFYKIRNSDVFVLLDTVDISQATSFTNRTRIKAVNGPIALTVPVRKGGSLVIRDVLVAADRRWRTKHLTSIRQAYGKAPHFSDVYGFVEAALAGSEDHLSSLNGGLIVALCRYMGIETPIVWASSLEIPQIGRSERLVEICKRLSASRYLSGRGGHSYNDEEVFGQAGIEVVYSQFREPQRPQLHGKFVEGLSTIDALFNSGAEATRLLSRDG